MCSLTDSPRAGGSVERDPNKAGLMLVKNRIARTRITVWDVLHYLETGWACPEIAKILHLSEAQVEAVTNRATTDSVG